LVAPKGKLRYQLFGACQPGKKREERGGEGRAGEGCDVRREGALAHFLGLSDNRVTLHAAFQAGLGAGSFTPRSSGRTLPVSTGSSNGESRLAF
jgi:hypothetical protein